MANKPIAMSRPKALIRLYVESALKSKIDRITVLTCNTVKSYLQKIESLSLTEEDLLSLREQDLYKLLQEQISQPSTDRVGDLYSFFRYMEMELKKTWSNTQTLVAGINITVPQGISSKPVQPSLYLLNGYRKPSQDRPQNRR